MKNFSMKQSILKIIACILILLIGVTFFVTPASVVRAEEKTTEDGPDFVFVCPNKAHEYWLPLIYGMEEADKKLGTHTEVIGPDSYDNWQENLIANMTAVLNRETKPDGIVVRGVGGMAPLIDKAAGMGIPVITVDTDVEGSKRAAYVGSNISQLGKKAAQAIVSHIPEGSELGMVMTTSDPTDSQFEIRDSFESIVSDYGMTIAETATVYLQDENGNEKPKDAMVADIKEMLAAHPNIKALFTAGSVNAAYAAQAKVELGLDDLFIVGQDDTEDNLAYVRSGAIHALTVQRTNLMGYLSVINLKKYIDEGSLPKKTYDTGITLVTLDNIDTYNNLDSGIGTEVTEVTVGYYTEENFQEGSESERKSGYAYDFYQTLASFAGWKYKYVYITEDNKLQKLNDGTVDIVAGVNKTSTTESYYHLKEMGLTDEGGERCFAVKKDSVLTAALDYAMEQIEEFFPTFTIELYQKYYNQNSVHSTLTNRETNWLIEKNILFFGYVPNLLPFSGEDADGNPIGLAGELIRLLEAFTEIDIVPVRYETVTDLEKALQSGKADVGFPTRKDAWVAESKNLLQSDSVIADRMMIIYYGAYTPETTGSIAYNNRSLGMKEYLEINYPDSQINLYKDFLDMLNAVSSGKEKCIIGYSSILQRLLSGYDGYDKLNVSYLNTSEELCLSVNQNNGILTVILNKMLRQTNQEVITGTLLQYASIERAAPTFADFFVQYAYIFAIVFSVFVVILAVTFAYYIRKSRQHSRQQEALQLSLQEAAEQAEQASKAKTNFLSSMSHDIRTPMNAIVGMTDIAKKYTGDKEKLDNCLEKISLSSQHLLTLINDVLDISKIESGKLALNPVNFSLRKLTDNLVNIARPMIKSQQHEFDVHIHDVNYELLYGDELRISQIFINILSNAIKYTPHGGKIVLDLYEELIDDKTVRLTYTVSDNGIGMSPEYMEHMYEMFTRADDSRTNKIQGTGLGLAIVKQMVTMMNGTIDCESEQNKGTTFTIKMALPIGEDDSRKYTLPPVDILLVDDDEIFLAITEDAINEMGARAETACCGEKAIGLIKARREQNNDYAVVIVDWKMPDMDGLEAVRAIRKIVGKNTSIILVSAYDWADIENDAKSSGADGFISKPLFKSYLSDKIGRLLETEKSDDTATKNFNGDLMGLHVLIAEDNDLNWEVISELLETDGITAERAENGKIAVEMLQNSQDGAFDLVFMDVQMPVMNGKEATKEIRKSERSYVKNIPIIAMTADAFAEDIAACLASGMNEHVAKPIDMNKTRQAIKRVLDRQGS